MAAPGRTTSGAASLFARTLFWLLMCALLKCAVLAQVSAYNECSKTKNDGKNCRQTQYVDYFKQTRVLDGRPVPEVETLRTLGMHILSDGKNTTLLRTKAGKQITCACTTQHCREQGTSRCNTTSMCYTQYLQSRDPNTDPITRGCINSRTPLLCENRRPAVHSAARWPQLICCSASLCNQGVLLPPSSADTASSWPALRPEAASSGGIDGGPLSTELPPPPQSPPADGSDERLLSPVHVAVLSVGACALFAVALLVIVALVRRHAGLLGARYVRGNYIKGRRQSASEDSPPNGGTYDNKMAVVS